MKQNFASIEEAFKWFLDNVYPTLPASEKQGKLKNAWRDYTYRLGIGEKRMQQILSQYGKIEVKTLVSFTPK